MGMDGSRPDPLGSPAASCPDTRAKLTKNRAIASSILPAGPALPPDDDNCSRGSA